MRPCVSGRLVSRLAKAHAFCVTDPLAMRSTTEEGWDWEMSSGTWSDVSLVQQRARSRFGPGANLNLRSLAPRWDDPVDPLAIAITRFMSKPQAIERASSPTPSSACSSADTIQLYSPSYTFPDLSGCVAFSPRQTQRPVHFGGEPELEAYCEVSKREGRERGFSPNYPSCSPPWRTLRAGTHLRVAQASTRC